MAKRFSELSDEHIAFIQNQKVYFVATAAKMGRINLSPKGMDSLRVLGNNKIAWLNLTGSGNETATHIQQQPRMTVMFCAFEGKPDIIRLYGEASVLHTGDSQWSKYMELFPPATGARQIFILDIDLVQSSCGFSVPLLSYEGDREILTNWTDKKGSEGVRDYWEERNQISLDGHNTNIVELSSTDSVNHDGI